MSAIKARQSLKNLTNALEKLKLALAEPRSNSLAIDGTIQRFEFVIELYWKTLKRLLELEGIEANTPKEVLKKAYAAQWLEDEAAWLQMLQDRNETSYVYDEEKALEIYEHIQSYFPLLQNTYLFLRKKLP